MNPTALLPSIKRFDGVFSKPQRFHFQRYIVGLSVAEKGRKTINSMNKIFFNHKDQSSFNRFLTKSDWDYKKMNRRRLRIFTRRRKGGILALDDSVIEKTGDRIEGAGFIYSNAKRKSVLGHAVVSTHYVNHNEQIPVNLEVYCKKGKTKNFRTKIQLAIQCFGDAFNHVIPRYAVFDGWYLGRPVTEFLGTKKVNWISRVKLNRKVKVKRWSNVKRLAKRLKYKKCNIKYDNKQYTRMASQEVLLNTIGDVKLVFLKRRGRLRVFATNAVNLDDETIIGIYKKRHSIDSFYRDSKQNLGMGAYQVRSLLSVVKHLHLVFLAYTLLRVLVSGLKEVCTIGEACRYLKNKAIEKLAYGIRRGAIKIMDLKTAKL